MNLFSRRFATAFLAGLFVLTVGACDTLETEPEQSIDASVALDELSGFESLLNTLYDDLQDSGYYSQQFMLDPEILADNLDLAPGSSGRLQGERVNAVGAHVERWGGHYATINKSNYIISEIQTLRDDETVTDETANGIVGQAYFIRALNYFDLARAKSYEPGQIVDGWDRGVVIRTEPTRDIENADERARASVDETYSQIIGDLQSAIETLDGSDLNSKVRPNAVAARALLARVYLYQGDNANAERLATQAINMADDIGAELVEAENYVDSWTGPVNHPESLFELNFTSTETLGGGILPANESLAALTTPAGFGDIVPSEDLLNAHAPDDVRGDLYFTENGTTYSLKFAGDSYNSEPYLDNVPIIRLSEVYLIRAEARAKQNENSQALSDLNAIRSRRGLDDSDGGGSIVDAVLQERRLEFAQEGQRFFDLKRNGRDIPKPQLLDASDVPYENFRILSPLPQGEVERIEVLEQNPGY